MERGKKRSGLADVAQRAGVGLATVDRVLNERGSVSPETERRVIAAAQALGLRRILPSPHRRQLRIEVILARSITPFMERLTRAMGQVAETLDRSIIVQRTILDMRDPASVAPRILSSRADGIIIYCEEHPANVAAIAASEAAGRPVICVVTDVPDAPRAAYVGIDHAKAGRTAGLLAARLVRGPGRAIVISTSIGFRAHRQRIDGFHDAVALHNPDLSVISGITTGDDQERAYHQVAAFLREGPEVVAVYNTGGGNRGAAMAIRDSGRRGKTLFLGHELTEETQRLLRDGEMTVTIDQAPELQARRSIDLMIARLGASAGPPVEAEIAFTLHTAENC